MNYIFLKHIRFVFLIVLDAILINLAFLLAIFIRFDWVFPEHYANGFLIIAFLLTSLKLIIYLMSGLYQSLWRYAGDMDLLRIVLAVTFGSVISQIFILNTNIHYARSVYIISWMLTIFFIGGSRLSYRILRRTFLELKHSSKKVKKVMVIGAGSAGLIVIRELRSNTNGEYKTVVVIDDDCWKWKTKLNGIPVIGGIDKIPQVCVMKKVDEIIIAMPSVSRDQISEIIKICQSTGCKLKILPRIYDLIDGKITIKNVRDVSIEDLLGRKEVNLNTEEISGYLKDEVVLVTGGGGSIGSELCRQIAKYEPKKLIVLDIYENSAYDLQNEIVQNFKNLDFEVVIASIREIDRLREVFNTYHPGIIFHAAAHKHVSLMENNPQEAIKNNVIGTLNTAMCADEFNVKKFVLISTDKAVNPTNIMGASKRVAEMIIQSMNNESKTEFVAVRFGNVLGSNGSVLPLFKRQIANGGPVTVTHPDITRFFMTIPEAACLVIQAGAMAQGGEIFVLDMGNPVKIVDLAQDLIRLSGFKVDKDIKIEFTGLKPGEKLYEELLLEEEGLCETKQNGIFIAPPSKICFKDVLRNITLLRDNMIDLETIKKAMALVVLTYTGDKQ